MLGQEPCAVLYTVRELVIHIPHSCSLNNPGALVMYAVKQSMSRNVH